MQPISYLKVLLGITLFGVMSGGLIATVTGNFWLGYTLPLVGGLGCAVLIYKIIIKPQIEKAKRKNFGIGIKKSDKKISILIWLCIGFAVVCLMVGSLAGNQTASILGIVGFMSAGFIGIGYSNVLQFRSWRLNRKSSKLPLSYRIKKMKPYITNQDGKKLSITGRGEILFLSFLTWLVVLILCTEYLKINPVTEFEIASAGGFVVMGSLIRIYLSRKKRRMIVRFTPPPILEKYYFISCSVIITVVLSLTPLGWAIGVPIGLVIFGVVYLRAVRGRGFKKSGSSGSFKIHKHGWSRFENNFRRSRKFSF
ncbi:MAG: hypothetical protein ACRDFB_11080 [Rhabdochlamydiaceae bacterium]